MLITEEIATNETDKVVYLDILVAKIHNFQSRNTKFFLNQIVSIFIVSIFHISNTPR